MLVFKIVLIVLEVIGFILTLGYSVLATLASGMSDNPSAAAEQMADVKTWFIVSMVLLVSIIASSFIPT